MQGIRTMDDVRGIFAAFNDKFGPPVPPWTPVGQPEVSNQKRAKASGKSKRTKDKLVNKVPS